MKVYLSWSDEVSKQVAKILAEWIPKEVNGVEFIEPEATLRAGQRWQLELSKQLLKADLTILCITKASITSPWLLFEAGSLYMRSSKNIVLLLLVDLSIGEISGPLAQFQSFEIDSTSLQELLQIINKLSLNPIPAYQIENLTKEIFPILIKTVGISESDNGAKQQISWINRIRQAQKSFNKKELHQIKSEIKNLSISDGNILTELLRAYLNIRDYTGVLEEYNLLPINIQKDIEIQRLLPVAQLHLNKFDEAIQTLERILEREPRNPEIFGLLGRAYKGLYEENIKSSESYLASEYLIKSYEMFLTGFRLSEYDPYLGINAV